MDAIARIDELLNVADSESVGTSMRIPRALRDAAALAVAEFGAAPSTTALTTDALRAHLESLVVDAVLARHYEKYPSARPSLAEIAIALAQQEGHPLATDPDAIRRAAEQIVERHPAADPDDVLLWAEAQASPAA